MSCHDNRQGVGDGKRLRAVVTGKQQRALNYRQGGAAPDSGAGGKAQKSCRNGEQWANRGCPLDVLQAGQGSGSAKHPVCRLDDEGRMALPARRRRGPASRPEQSFLKGWGSARGRGDFLFRQIVN